MNENSPSAEAWGIFFKEFTLPGSFIPECKDSGYFEMHNKYLQVFKISFAQEFAYRLNFIMWRMRNVIQILITLYLWDTVFSDSSRVLFGYDRSKILTYVFGLIIVRAIVLSSRTIDIAGEISRGELSNYLVKPVNYFKYWLTRDVSSKALNLTFAVGESAILFLIFRPPFYIPNNLVSIFGFFLTAFLAMLLYFVLIFIVSTITFWMPEIGWGAHFLVTVVVVEFLSGALFPLDILPKAVQNVLSYTPFPYLIFFPLEVYLGKIAGPELINGLIICVLWLIILWNLLNYIWARGLKAYQTWGR